MDGRVLRSGDPAGLEQEMWSLPTLYQVLRTAMVEAAESLPGTDPDRCGFTLAFQSARDQVVQAAGVVTTTAEVVGLIGRRILAGLLPPRRPRVSTRKVKSPNSRHNERFADGRPDSSRTITALDIAVVEPAAEQSPLPTASRDDRYSSPADRRSVKALALLQQDPGRSWRARDLAHHLGDITSSTMYRQLSRWAATGLIHKTGPGIYTAGQGPPTPLTGTQER